MNGQQNVYQYPAVPPMPSQQQLKLQIDTRDNRFSFMPAQIEPETRLCPQDAPAYTTLPPPRLPSPPPDLMDEARYQVTPASRQINRINTEESLAHLDPDAQPICPPDHQQSEYILDTKNNIPHRPAPIKITTQIYRPRMSIGPDENPLSPSTAPYTPMWTPKTTNMSIVPPSLNSNIPTINYTPATPAPQIIHGGSWTHSTCSCAEPSICVTSLFCPCVVYGRTQYRLSRLSEKRDPTNMLGYRSMNGSCIAWSFLCGINGILTGLQRGRVRRAYDMDSESGNFFSDCLGGCCCCCCVLAQSEKELKYREESSRRIGGAMAGKNEGYVAPGGMVFSPPQPPAR